MKTDIFNIADKEINRFVVVERLIKGVKAVKEASEDLSLSIRQILRLKNY